MSNRLGDGVEFKLGMTIFAINSGYMIQTSYNKHEVVETSSGNHLRTKTDRPESTGPLLIQFASTWARARLISDARRKYNDVVNKVYAVHRDLTWANEIMREIDPTFGGFSIDFNAPAYKIRPGGTPEDTFKLTPNHYA